jgi:hypothetical protein
MAGRPLAPDEEERELTIGGQRFILRRLPKGELDVDYAPPDFSSNEAPVWKGTRPGRALPTPKPKGVPIGRIVFGILATLVIGGVFRYARSAVTYLRVPWESYTHDRGQFRVKFAGKPERSSKSVDTGGSTGTAVKLVSRYHDHAYLLEYVDLPGVVPLEKEAPLLLAIMKSIVKNEHATVLKHGWGHVSGHDALEFVAQFPQSKDWSQGTARGHLIVHKNRVYAVYAYTPQGESLAFDTGEYLRSLELPDF